MTVDIGGWVESVSIPDPYDQIGITGHAQASGASTSFYWAAYVSIGSSSADINQACVDAVTAAAVSHSYSVGAVRVHGATIDLTPFARVPGASSTVSLSSGTARQPSATRPVMVMVSGSWSWNLTAIGTQTGSLTLKSDSSSTPSTVIRAPSWSRGIGVGVSISDTGTMPVEFDLLVPPAHYYSVTAAGGATFSIREQTL